MPRFYCPIPLHTGSTVMLPAGAARHVQVLRLQPGDAIELFHGGLPHAQSEDQTGWFDATVQRMGRSDVEVQVGAWHAPLPSAPQRVHVLSVMPANERMDWLVEKATELGVASIQPLVSERSVLRLKADRADKKQTHWQAVAVAACEQSGRTQVPCVHPVRSLAEGLQSWQNLAATRLLLSLAEGAQPLAARLRPLPQATDIVVLAGPEGGLSPAEEALALQHGFLPTTLGDYVLRAETAPLAVLSCVNLMGMPHLA